MSGKIFPVPVLLVSLAAFALTTTQAAPPRTKSDPAVAKTSAAKKGIMEADYKHAQSPTKPDAFTVSRGTDTLRAMLVPAPPVYAPGGPVCFVEEWSGDEALLAEAEQTAAEHGAVLVRVTCAHSDSDRAELLARHGYAVASEWYTAPLPLPGTLSLHGIRPLTAADVPRVLELGEQKRREYQAYSPVFWRMSPLPRQTFAPYVQAQIASSDNVALAHERNGDLDGFVLANARGYIDDYTVAAPGLWPTVGADLLQAAGDAAHRKGINSLLVVCGAGDISKRRMLASQGLTLATDWYVKPMLPKK